MRKRQPVFEKRMPAQQFHATPILQQAPIVHVHASASPPTSTHLLTLQRTIGNRAVAQRMAEKRGQRSPSSTLLHIVPPEHHTGLPDALKAGVENLSGVCLDDVRVHYHSAQPARVEALAYAQGPDIYVGPGQEQHLAHEAWHVVQQKQGRVKPTLQAKEVAINADQELEREADAMGARATTVGRQVQGVPLSSKPVPPPLQVLQAVWEIQPTENVLSWTPPLDGVTWFKDQKWMWFQITHASDIQEGTLTAYQSWENKPHPYDFWQQARQQTPNTQPPPLPVMAQQTTDPISSIMATDLNQLKPVILENSRAKRVYLFDAAGQPAKNKSEADYMVDTAMDEKEYNTYQKVAQWGVRIPQIYGRTTRGQYPILQWIKKHTTAGGAGGRELIPSVSQRMKLDKIQKKPFDVRKWSQTLSEVEELIEKKYSSPDLQFMIEDTTGHLFIMDLESNNTPVIANAPDEKLLRLAEFLRMCLQNNGLVETSTPAKSAPRGSARPSGS